MRIAILAPGSRGDVQPYVALGKGLHDAGHDVKLISAQNYAALAASAGLAFHPNARRCAGGGRKQGVERLANAIQIAVSDTQMQQRAAELGAKIQAEDSVARAVEIISTH